MLVRSPPLWKLCRTGDRALVPDVPMNRRAALGTNSIDLWVTYFLIMCDRVLLCGKQSFGGLCPGPAFTCPFLSSFECSKKTVRHNEGISSSMDFLCGLTAMPLSCVLRPAFMVAWPV